MPRALKGLLQFVFGLAVICVFMYPRMWPLIRDSRARARALAQPVARSAVQGSAQSKRQPGPLPDHLVSFSSDVTLRKDATIEVREEFVAHSEADYFRWGMIRQLPIDSEARWDRQLVGPYQKDTGIRVKILELTEDGAPVSYEQGSEWGYPQLRIGTPDVPLAPGDHRFVIRYEADGVMQFLADHDQLYWNALGHYWRLPIDDVIVRVHLPPEIPAEVVTAEAYTGSRGRANALPAASGAPGAAGAREALADGFAFRASNLGSAQSLSVVLTWPKGFLLPPALGPLAHDSRLLIAPSLLLLYYIIVWLGLGRQPQRGAVAIQYQPPRGLSPAAIRYIRTTGCDGRTLAATIAQLAARGCIGIEPQGAKYKVTRLSGHDGTNDPKNLQPPLAPEELAVLNGLFEDGPEAVLDSKNGNPLNRYLMRINIELQKRLKNLYFTRHAGWLVLGTFASFLTALGMALTAQGRNADRMTVLFLTWWFFFCFYFLGLIAVMTLIPAIVRALRGLGGAKEVAIGSAIVAAFGGGGVAVLWQLKSGASLAFALSLLALVVINIAAFPALRRLTSLGRQVQDEIEGFRAFLEKVEQDRMRRVDPAEEMGAAHGAASGASAVRVSDSGDRAMLLAPSRTPNTGANTEFLPYAIALEVREPWGDHLADACVVTTTTR
jgi:Predicted membrane protein (DUF2207)